MKCLTWMELAPVSCPVADCDINGAIFSGYTTGVSSHFLFLDACDLHLEAPTSKLEE